MIYEKVAKIVVSRKLKKYRIHNKKERKNLFFRLINIVISKTKVISSMHLSSEWTTNETIGPHKCCPYIAHILKLTSNKRKKISFFFFFVFFFNEEINKKNKKIRDFDFYLIENILFFIALPIAVQLMLRHGNTSLQKNKQKLKKKK